MRTLADSRSLLLSDWLWVLLFSDSWVPATFWPRLQSEAYTACWAQEQDARFQLTSLLFGLVKPAVSKPAFLRQVRHVPSLPSLRSASAGGLSITRLKCQEGLDYVTFNRYSSVLGRGESTLVPGEDGCRQDSGDCMSTWAGSEFDGCFFLGILNGMSILMKQHTPHRVKHKPIASHLLIIIRFFDDFLSKAFGLWGGRLKIRRSPLSSTQLCVLCYVNSRKWRNTCVMCRF